MITSVRRTGLAWAIAAICSSSVVAADELVIEKALLRLIDQVEIPAQEPGLLLEVLVREGQTVTRGQPIARIDDRESQLAWTRADLEWKSAQLTAADETPVALARKGAAKQAQLLVEQQAQYAAAEKEAGSDLSVQAASKAMEVAGNQHERALGSRELFRASVSDAEIDGLRLAFERSTLEHEQAGLNLTVLRMKLLAQHEALNTQKLAVEIAELEIAEQEEKRRLAGRLAELKRQDADLARLSLERRTIGSPLDGVVVEVARQAGEWVEPGDKVMRIIRLDRLRVEGLANLADIDGPLVGCPVVILATSTDGSPIERRGVVTFVDPEAEPVSQEVRVWAEFDNPQPQLLPGMKASMRVGAAPPAPRAPAAGKAP